MSNKPSYVNTSDCEILKCSFNLKFSRWEAQCSPLLSGREEVEGNVIVCDIFPMTEDRGHSLRTINITWRELPGLLLYKCLL